MTIQFVKPDSTDSSDNNRKIREFSKRFVAVICALWIIGALFGGVLVWRYPDQLSYLLDYISGPMEVGVIGYLVKTAFENREKVRQNPDYLRNSNVSEDGPGADGPG